MEYLIIGSVLVVVMLLYFRIASHYNIIDKPNHRSAHTEITLRGGGIIFPVSFLLWVIISFLVDGSANVFQTGENPNFWLFGCGLLLISVISFADDMMDLSTRIRLLVHVISVTFLLLFLNAFVLLPLWFVPVAYILVIGILNAYNFMDGINGMSGVYSLVLFSSLLYVNNYVTYFVSPDFIIYPLLACLVFLFFNFRKKAKCFLGDIGSMGIGFWVIGLISLLMIETGEIKWVLFLSVYGVETILTIIERLSYRENIFEAHRRHLYQLLVNEKKISHLSVSAVYAFIQMIINGSVLFFQGPDWLFYLVILLPAVGLYLGIKQKIKKSLRLYHK